MAVRWVPLIARLFTLLVLVCEFAKEVVGEASSSPTELEFGRYGSGADSDPIFWGSSSDSSSSSIYGLKNVVRISWLISLPRDAFLTGAAGRGGGFVLVFAGARVVAVAAGGGEGEGFLVAVFRGLSGSAKMSATWPLD